MVSQVMIKAFYRFHNLPSPFLIIWRFLYSLVALDSVQPLVVIDSEGFSGDEVLVVLDPVGFSCDGFLVVLDYVGFAVMDS